MIVFAGEGRHTSGTPSRFTSSDAFSALFFVQSLAVGILFFLMPYFKPESQTGSTPWYTIFGPQYLKSFLFCVCGEGGVISWVFFSVDI